MNIGFIYITTNLVSGRKYIGKKYYYTNSGKETNWRTYLGSSRLLLADIKQLGADNFSKEIICECSTKEELAIKERLFIEQYNAVGDEMFYNMSNGFDKFYTTSDGVLKGLNTRRKWSPEKKQQVSDKLRERLNKLTVEERDARSKKKSNSSCNCVKIQRKLKLDKHFTF